MNLIRSPGLRYVHRTEPGAFDWDGTTLSKDPVWHTLSLAAIVPANAKLVCLKWQGSSATVGSRFMVAKVGETGQISNFLLAAVVSGKTMYQSGIVDCLGNQIAYMIDTAIWTNLGMVVTGWFV